MFPIRLLTVAVVALAVGASAAQEKKPKQYVKLSAELKGQLEQQLIAGGDQYWRLGFTAKGGGSLRMAVRVGKETWELSLPDDEVMPAQAAKLVGQEVVVQGTLEPAPTGWSLPIFPTRAGPHEGYIIRVTSLKAAEAK
jgi:uroporphyrinogen-III decarboxylase